MVKSSARELAGRGVGYRPEAPVRPAPLFEWPPRLPALLKWLPNYVWPWQTFFFLVAAACWLYFSPATEQLTSVSLREFGVLLVRNCMLLIAFTSAWHFWLYVRRAQGAEYKYSADWLAIDDATFLFRNQLWDNVFWSLCCAVPIWTAYEAASLWLHANQYIPAVDWGSDPVYCTLLALAIPLWVQTHFYVFHRLLHWRPLYRSIHYIHHKNINVGPWSGLAMHPIEHVLMFSAVAFIWIIPSHPVHCLFALIILAIGPTISHSGFNRVKLGGQLAIPAADYMHYLHHKHVRVNYGGVLVPLDKWFGTFHDGSEEAREAMKRRARQRASRLLRKNDGSD